MKFPFPSPDQIITFTEFCTICDAETENHAFFQIYHALGHRVQFAYHCSCCYQYFPNDTHEFTVNYSMKEWLDFISHDDLIRDN